MPSPQEPGTAPNGPARAGTLWQALGPGLVFAAAAVGVSHLVQSTRAGAVFGLAMLGVVLAANLIKYPAFRMGPQYASATGQSLLHGYARIGRWAVVLYMLLTLATMFTVAAAVTVVTAGLAIAITGVDLSAPLVSALLLAVSGVILGLGQYRALDRLAKVLVALLTLATLVASALALSKVVGGPAAATLSPFSIDWTDTATIAFAVSLFGWMPSAIDVSVWQSLWALERNRDQGGAVQWRSASKDFHIGYIGTTVLAVCFLVMGAGVMFGSGTTFSDSAGGFARQVLDLYGSVLGGWTTTIVGIAAFSVMFSTTLTVADGFPRGLTAAIERLRNPEACDDNQRSSGRTTIYLGLVATQALGAALLLAVAMSSLRQLIDVATTLSFLTAPALSALNHVAMSRVSADSPAAMSPGLRTASLTGLALQTVFALGYIVFRISTAG
jgi:Mn2+/Fe2+ NRAMP family transporter